MKEYKYFTKTLAISFFIILQNIIFFGVWKRFNIGTLFNNLDKSWAIIIMYTTLLLVFSKIFGVYNIGNKRLIDSLFGHFVTITLSNMLVYLQLSMIKNWPYFYAFKVLCVIMLIELCVMSFFSIIMYIIFYFIEQPKKTLFIRSWRDNLKVDQNINKILKDFNVEEIVDIEIGEEEIEKKILNYENVLMEELPSKIRNNLLKFCFENKITCYGVPKTSDIIINSGKENRICHTSVLIWDNKGLRKEQEIIKRIIDIFISLFGLFCLSPLFLLIAILIKIYDKGPIIYKQERLTKDGEKFMIYKFRTMIVDSEKNGAQLASKNDSRITPIGKILRNTHIDELPQLWNILNGDMSLVGPRPERPEVMETYLKEYPEFRYRLKAKAGLTGYAQVYGKYNTNPNEKLKFDLIYILNYSVLLDLKLIFLTFKIMFQKETSEGIEDDKKNAL
jgi:exopolysaccharide biosynthesis polyprenyl glycosylphosphotransferase